MIRLPTAVEPVKVMRSTRGSVVMASPMSLRPEVMMLRTPGGMSVFSAASFPSARAAQGVAGAPLSTTVLPAAKAGAILAMLSWWGKFQAVMAPTTPTASFSIHRWAGMPMGSALPRSSSPLVGLGQVGVVGQELDRGVQLGTVGQRDRGAHLGHGRGPDLLQVVPQGGVQLAQATGPQVDVRGPVGLVEGPAGGGDGPVDVAHRRVGGDPEHLLVRRVDVLVGRATLGVDELAVDEEPFLVPEVHHGGRAYSAG